MHLKHILALVCTTGFTAPAIAQSAIEGVKQEHSARVEFGVRTGGFLFIERSDGVRQLNNLHGVLGGAAVRLRSGKEHRFGLELAAHHGVTEQSFTPIYSAIGPAERGTGFRKRTSDVVLQAQCHPGRDDQAVQPFVGGGLGAAWDQYTSNNRDLEGQLNNYMFGMGTVQPILQLEQGLTWRVGEHFYLSQSLYYRYAMDDGSSNVGIRIGGFYGL